MTPHVLKAHESGEQFLAGVDGPVLPPIPITEPADNTPDSVLKAIFACQSALIQGVNELRASAVTRESLTQFYGLQSRATQAYVQAETTPLHRSVAAIDSDVKDMKQGISRLEAQMMSGSSGEARAEPHDPARRRVAFIGFGSHTTVDERFAVMDSFMKSHFPEVRPSCTNLFPDKTGRPSLNGYVELSSPAQVRMITDQVRARSLQIEGHKNLKIKAALTDIDRSRVWALAKAEEIIKASPLSSGKTVSVKRGDKRGVYVNDTAAFSQEQRFARGGSFLGEYAGLQLP